MFYMFITTVGGTTLPRASQPCDELSQAAAPESDEPRRPASEDASCLTKEALHLGHSSNGFRHPIDSFGSSAPILAAAPRSPAKLLAC